MATEFLWERRVGFGDCDPAQIAFTGRIVDFALEALDAFWDDTLDGAGWYAMAVDKGQGMPFVRIEMDFMRPISPRLPLRFRVKPQEIGRSSIKIWMQGVHGDEIAFEASFISVFVSRPDMAPSRVPDEVRDKLREKYRSVGFR